MLKQRIITALVLLAFLLPALFADRPAAFFLMTLVFIGAGAWEWGRMNGGSSAASWLAGVACALACAVLWRTGVLQQPLPLLWLGVGLAWVVLGAWALRRGVPAWAGVARAWRLLVGWVALCATWLALAQAKLLGVNFLLSVMALVWAADITAYFVGRAVGGRFIARKLAASISPGKSWEGALGGALGVVLLALLWRFADAAWGLAVPSLYTRLAGRGLSFLMFGCLFLAAMSVVGDLLESLVKRSAGVKDSSALLPGHGGVLDRVDALLPTLPLAMWLVSW